MEFDIDIEGKHKRTIYSNRIRIKIHVLIVYMAREHCVSFFVCVHFHLVKLTCLVGKFRSYLSLNILSVIAHLLGQPEPVTSCKSHCAMCNM